MLTSEIMDLINELESVFPVDQWVVDGLHVWPFLRIKLNFDLFYLHHTRSTTPSHSNNKYATAAGRIAKNFYRYTRAYCSDNGKNSDVSSPVDAVFLSDGISFSNIEGLWFERLCDPLIGTCIENGITFRLITPSDNFHVPRRTSSKFIQPFLDLARVRAAVKSRVNETNDYHLPGYQDFHSYFEKKSTGIQVPSIHDMLRFVSSVKAYAEYFKGILVNLNPKIASLVSYYGIEGMAFILACRELNIRCVDLQHGLQGDLHVAYGRWNKVPENGYELLPDYFWCWSSADAAAIQRWSQAVFNNHVPLIGGNPWLDFWKDSSNKLVVIYDQKLQKAVPGFSDNKNILVTLQSNLDDPETLKPILDAVATLDERLFWWIRLHPCMLDKRDEICDIFNTCGGLNFDIDMATDFPLYTLLRHVDIHVTHSSSTVIEAESFGVPSVLLSEYGAEFFPDQIASGVAVLAKPDLVTEVILQQLIDHPKKGPDFYSKDSSKSDETFLMLFSGIISGLA